MKMLINDDSGLTLMELIISLALISIIAIAMFTGMQYAYYIIASSREYVEELYTAQLELENDLSFSNLGMSFSSTDLASESAAIPDLENLDFIWDTSGSALYGDTYTIVGYSIELEVQGGAYLDETIKVYVPTNQITSP